MRTKKAFPPYPPLKKQRGVIVVIVAIGMAALIGVVGLALDSGHLFLNKTRLQNAVDAAALSGALALQQSTSATPMADARAAAIANFTANLSNELSAQAPVPTVTFSEDLTPGSFAAATPTPPNYIKVESPAVSLTSFLVRVVGFDDKRVAATAVAGFGYGVDVCDMIPVMVCGLPDDPNVDDVFGYRKFNELDFDPLRDTIRLKHGTNDQWDPDVGSGNYHVLNLPNAGNGFNAVRDGLAGKGSCGTQDDYQMVNTQPGIGVGPVSMGIDTRFGIYHGNMNSARDLYPPDYANENGSSCDGQSYTNTYQNPNDGTVDENYDTDTDGYACLDPRNYYKSYANNSWTRNPAGPTIDQYQRRIVTMPIVDCGPDGQGDQDLRTLGFGCFLLTSPSSQTGGNPANSGAIQGVFIERCFPPSRGISENSGATNIVLYKNPDGVDS